jgi:hypothetical protein
MRRARRRPPAPERASQRAQRAAHLASRATHLGSADMPGFRHVVADVEQ